jgi:hypothetical protein
VSTRARTFLPTRGGQSLIADLIEQGATGAKGYADEPLLQAVASPSILFERYTRGWTLAESYYAAARLIGRQDVVIGDPLAGVIRKCILSADLLFEPERATAWFRPLCWQGRYSFAAVASPRALA